MLILPVFDHLLPLDHAHLISLRTLHIRAYCFMSLLLVQGLE